MIDHHSQDSRSVDPRVVALYQLLTRPLPDEESFSSGKDIGTGLD